MQAAIKANVVVALRRCNLHQTSSERNTKWNAGNFQKKKKKEQKENKKKKHEKQPKDKQLGRGCGKSTRTEIWLFPIHPKHWYFYLISKFGAPCPPLQLALPQSPDGRSFVLANFFFVEENTCLKCTKKETSRSKSVTKDKALCSKLRSCYLNRITQLLWKLVRLHLNVFGETWTAINPQLNDPNGNGRSVLRISACRTQKDTQNFYKIFYKRPDLLCLGPFPHENSHWKTADVGAPKSDSLKKMTKFAAHNHITRQGVLSGNVKAFLFVK